MRLSDVLFPGEYASSFDAESITFSHMETDTRKDLTGALFLCLRGGKFDTHDCLSILPSRGVCAAIVDERFDAPVPKDFPLFCVPDCRRTYACVASRLCGNPGERLRLIGVTGTAGKTSVTYLLRAILTHANRRVGLIGTTGIYFPGDERPRPVGDGGTMTTPDPPQLYETLAALAGSGCDDVVMEVSSHALALSKLAPLNFTLALFTGLSPEHLDFHGDMEHYLAAKKILFTQSRCGVINGDSPYADAMTEGLTLPCVRCGEDVKFSFHASDIRCDGASVAYTLCAHGETQAIRLPLAGRFQVTNSLLAIAAADALGIPIPVSAEALASVDLIPGRMEKIGGTGDIDVYIDYAHTPEALEAAVRSARAWMKKGRLIVLFGCGGDRDRSKRAPMGHIAETYADVVILTSDNCRTEKASAILRDIRKGIRKKRKIKVIVDRARAIEYAIHTARAGDCVLLVGKGHEDYEICGTEKRPFSEKEIVRRAIGQHRKQV